MIKLIKSFSGGFANDRRLPYTLNFPMSTISLTHFGQVEKIDQWMIWPDRKFGCRFWKMIATSSWPSRAGWLQSNRLGGLRSFTPASVDGCLSGTALIFPIPFKAVKTVKEATRPSDGECASVSYKFKQSRPLWRCLRFYGFHAIRVFSGRCTLVVSPHYSLCSPPPPSFPFFSLKIRSIVYWFDPKSMMRRIDRNDRED